VMQSLFSIRQAHLAIGCGDPLSGKARVWAAVEGLQRWSGARLRKLPVTPKMLKWIKGYIFQELEVDFPTKLVWWLAVTIGWFYLLRQSEYMPLGPCDARAVRGVDLEFWRNDQKALTADGNELVVTIRSSKTDPLGFGTTRNHYETEEDLCPVAAARAYFKAFPGRFRGGEAELPLMRDSGGDPLSRGRLQQILKLAASAEGEDPGRMGSHSLRIGGATTMFHVVPEAQRTRRFGRWASDAYHIYWRDSHEEQRGVARDMARDTSVMRQPKEPERNRGKKVRFGP